MTIPLVKQGEGISAARQNSIAGSINRLEARLGLDTQATKRLRGGQELIIAQAWNTSSVTLLPEWTVVITGEAELVDARAPILKVELATVESQAASMAVVMSVIEPGTIGQVAVSGVVWALAQAGGAGALARPMLGTAQLVLGGTGPAQVLAGAGSTRVLIRFPTGSGDGSGVGGTVYVPAGWVIARN